MKAINIIKTTLSIFLALSILNACNKMDTTYKKFVVPGGLTYPAQIAKPLVYAGKNRVKISWLKSSDPNIVKVRIFWNNYADSLEVPVSQDQDTINVIIDNLAEQIYSFYVRSYDDKGNVSVPTELFGKSFGDQYGENLLSRPINRAVLFDDGKATISWGAANITGGAYASEVVYTNKAGAEVKQLFSVEESSNEITDLKEGSNVRFRTVYLPDSLTIDTFYTAFEDFENFYYDKSSWKVIDFSTNHGGSDNSVNNIIDGTYKTRWHTLVGSRYPHFVVVDMQRKITITQFSVERTDYAIPGGDDRGPDTFQFLVSDDNVVWEDLGVFNFNRLLNGEQFYPISPAAGGRYFKFIALTGPLDYMSLGEISIYGK